MKLIPNFIGFLNFLKRKSAENSTQKQHFLHFPHFFNFKKFAVQKSKNPRKLLLSRVLDSYPGAGIESAQPQ